MYSVIINEWYYLSPLVLLGNNKISILKLSASQILVFYFFPVLLTVNYILNQWICQWLSLTESPLVARSAPARHSLRLLHATECLALGGWSGSQIDVHLSIKRDASLFIFHKRFFFIILLLYLYWHGQVQLCFYFICVTLVFSCFRPHKQLLLLCKLGVRQSGL